MTDKDGNGVADTTDGLLQAAQEKLSDAVAKQKAAQDLLSKANENGLITPAEAEAITAANQALAEAKAAADAAVKALPETVKEKAELQGKVDALTPAEVPAVTDKNDNGVNDALERKFDDLMKPLKEAYKILNEKIDVLAKSDVNKEIDQKVSKEVSDSSGAFAKALVAVQTLVNEMNEKSSGRKEYQKQINELKVRKVLGYHDDVGDSQGEFRFGGETDDAKITVKGINTFGKEVYVYGLNVDNNLILLGSGVPSSNYLWNADLKQLPNRLQKIYFSEEKLDLDDQSKETVKSLGEPQVITINAATQAPMDIGVKSSRWSASTAGDLDGDGFDDIGTNSWANYNPDSVYGSKDVSKLTALDNFKLGAWHQSGVGDVNGDGHNDILVGTAKNSDIILVLGDKDKSITKVKSIDGFKDHELGGVASAGDVNGDGLPDMLALAGKQLGLSTLYFGSTDIVPGKPVNSAVKNLDFGQAKTGTQEDWGAQQYASALGDFNGDGFNDVVTSNGIFFGSSLGLSNENSIRFNHPVTAAYAAGDFNGDGFADAAVIDGNNRVSYIIFGGSKAKKGETIIFGTKSNGEVHATITGGNGGVAIYSNEKYYQSTEVSAIAGVGDLNGDGLADITISTYGNPGDTTKGDKGVLSGTYTSYTSSDSSIIFGTKSTGNIELDKFGNKGIFIPKTQADGASVVGMLDVNGDGFSDVYIGSYNTPGKLYIGGINLGAEPSFQSDGTGTEVEGTKNSDFIVGSSNDDVIYGRGGADVIYSGAGNDKIILNNENLLMLSLGLQETNSNGSEVNMGHGRLARVDGGSGNNTLAFDKSVSEVDLTKISNAGTGFIETAVGMSRIANIDKIDLTDAVKAKLILTLVDVMDMNSGVNSFNDKDFSKGTTQLGERVSRHQLLINGDAEDSVIIRDGREWIKDSVGTVVKDSKTYNVYNSANPLNKTVGDNRGQLLIDEKVKVTFENTDNVRLKRSLINDDVNKNLDSGKKLYKQSVAKTVLHTDDLLSDASKEKVDLSNLLKKGELSHSPHQINESHNPIYHEITYSDQKHHTVDNNMIHDF